MFILYVFFTPIRFCSASGLVGRPLDAVEFRSQSDLSVPGMLCGIRYPREGQSSYKATLSFIMAYKRQY